MIGLDTNILVRIVAKDDPEQAKAAADFIDGGDTFFVPITVTLELEWVLRSVLKLRRPERGAKRRCVAQRAQSALRAGGILTGSAQAL